MNVTHPEGSDESSPLRVLSWNVNGLRACLGKGFGDWLANQDADVIGLQEVRATPDQLPDEVAKPADYHATWVAPTEKKGYSGVGLLLRDAPEQIITSLGEQRFDVEGRFAMARIGALRVASVYFPNGSGPDRDHSRVPYKLDFTRRVFELLEEDRKAGWPILVMGDFNTAHKPIDLARPKTNKKTSGYLMRERRVLGGLLRRGWVDTFRHLHPRTTDVYSWWSQRRGVRERNVGWRIDYVYASEAVLPYLRQAFVQTEVMGSDHCPVGVELDRAVLTAGPGSTPG